MYLKYLVLSIFLFQPVALAGVGGKYFCLQTEINKAGYRANLMLEWKDKTIHMKFLKHEELNLIPEVKSKIVYQIENYFIAHNEDENGKLAHIFNGETLVTTYLQNTEESNTFYPKKVVSKYQCEKI